MRSWLAARWRMCSVVGGALVVVLVGSVLWATQWSDGSTASDVDCSLTIAETFDEAGMIAAACGSDVEVVEARSPWTTTWALEDGSNRLEQTTSLPARP